MTSPSPSLRQPGSPESLGHDEPDTDKKEEEEEEEAKDAKSEENTQMDNTQKPKTLGKSTPLMHTTNGDDDGSNNEKKEKPKGKKRSSSFNSPQSMSFSNNDNGYSTDSMESIRSSNKKRRRSTSTGYKMHTSKSCDIIKTKSKNSKSTKAADTITATTVNNNSNSKSKSKSKSKSVSKDNGSGGGGGGGLSKGMFSRFYKHSYSPSNLSYYSQDDSTDFLTDGYDDISGPETYSSDSPPSNLSNPQSPGVVSTSSSSGSSSGVSTSSDSGSGGSSGSSSDKRGNKHKGIKRLLNSIRKGAMYPSFVVAYGFSVVLIAVALTMFASFLLSSTMVSRARKHSISCYTELSWRHKDVVVRRLEQVESLAVVQAGVPGLFSPNSSYTVSDVVPFVRTFLNTFDGGYSCGVSRSNGDFVGVYFKGNTMHTDISSGAANNNSFCSYVNDEYKGKTCASQQKFNVLEKKWYRAVANSTKQEDARWTGFVSETDPLYVYSVPVFEDGVFVGVSSASALYESIGTTILAYPENSAPLEEADFVFGIDLSDGSFLGATTVSSSSNNTNSTKHKKVSVMHVGNVEVLDAADALYKQWESSWSSPSVKDITLVTRYGRTVSAAVIERPGMRWAVVMVGFREISTSTMDVVIGPIIIFSVFLLAIFAVGLGIDMISPVTTLSRDMIAISELRFSDVTGRRGFSHLQEIRTAQESFRKMAVGIEVLTKYAPISVVRDVMQSGAEAVVPHAEPMYPVATMFVDIVGLSQLVSGLPPRVFFRLLTHWFQEFSTIIQSTHGTIDKFIGGGILAFYGVPHPVRTPVRGACTAAVEFREAIKRVNKYGEHLSKKQGVVIPALTYRVGVHSGPVLAGHFGYAEHLNYTAVGSATVVASRMEQLGKYFRVTPLVTGTVAHEVANDFLCVFLNLAAHPNCNGGYVHVYHLVGRKKEVPKKYFLIAKTFDQIHTAVQEGDTQRALFTIKSSLENERFKIYNVALKILRQSIEDGRISKDAYSNTSNSSYSKSHDPSSVSSPAFFGVE